MRWLFRLLIPILCLAVLAGVLYGGVCAFPILPAEIFFRLPCSAPEPVGGSSAWWNVVTGGEFCHLTNNGRCVTDGSYGYGNNERCTVTAVQSLFATASQYEVESCCDYVSLGSIRYQGIGPLNTHMMANSTLSWSSDGSTTSAGFTICATSGNATSE
jgi:hypothetical protein